MVGPGASLPRWPRARTQATRRAGRRAPHDALATVQVHVRPARRGSDDAKDVADEPHRRGARGEAIRRSDDKERAGRTGGGPAGRRSSASWSATGATIQNAKNTHQSTAASTTSSPTSCSAWPSWSCSRRGCASACSRASRWRSSAWPSSSSTTPTSGSPLPSCWPAPGTSCGRTACSRSSSGRRQPAPRRHGPRRVPERGRAAPPPQQALHAALLTRP